MNINHLLCGVALISALAVSAPVWAQVAGGNSYGGNSMGIPGPNPGGPEVPGTINGGLFGHTPSPPPASSLAMRSVYNYTPQTESSASQLNQEELARLQSGGSMPLPQYPPAGRPSRSGGNSMDMPGPNPGGPGLMLYNR